MKIEMSFSVRSQDKNKVARAIARAYALEKLRRENGVLFDTIINRKSAIPVVLGIDYKIKKRGDEWAYDRYDGYTAFFTISVGVEEDKAEECFKLAMGIKDIIKNGVDLTILRENEKELFKVLGNYAEALRREHK